MAKQKLPWSKASFLAAIKKLELKRGDILLVRDFRVIEQLESFKLPLGFDVPLIMDPSGVGVSKLSRQQLLDALDQLDLINEKNAEQKA